MLKVGIFGVGHLGKFHLNNWKEMPGVKMEGFYDPDDTNADAVSKKYNLKRYHKPEELLDLVDAANFAKQPSEKANTCLLKSPSLKTCNRPITW